MIDLLAKRRRHQHRDGGFVLIGVVVFVLALTILGLSLFGLSSYEAQFLVGSIHDTQAFYCASGGIERAKRMIAELDDLDAVTRNLPVDNVIYARARYVNFPEDTASSPVIWDGSRGDIEICVLAEEPVGKKRRMLEARFRPQDETPAPLYDHLIASCSGVTVADSAPPEAEAEGEDPYDPRLQIFLDGKIRQPFGSDFTWAGQVGSVTPGPYPGAVPLPQIPSYISTHRAGAPEPDRTVQDGHSHYWLNNAGGTRFYFGSDLSGSEYDLEDGYTDPEFHVRGTVIWMLERGLKFENRVKVFGQSSDRLIIVAGHGSDDHPQMPNAGIWFKGGLTSPDGIPVILVSDGTVALDTSNDRDQSAIIRFLSIFANHVYLRGPQPVDQNGDPGRMDLQHDTGRDGDLQALYDAGLLPNTPAGQERKLRFLAGTWRDITPN